MNVLQIIQRYNWQDLSDADGFAAWKAAKLSVWERAENTQPLRFPSFAEAPNTAIETIKSRLSTCNFAIYETADSSDEIGAEVLGFAARLGLTVSETHRSAGAFGLVALTPSSEESKRGYIPYTHRALNWHTDGYYNDADTRVGAFILHCVRPAVEGGINQLIDPEIAYLRLREENPDFIRALMHPEAMTIPENREPDGSLRPASVGPVFLADPATGRMTMRYTARTRSIEWRDDQTTIEAADWLRNWLMAGDPLMVEHRMSAGQGVVNNNVLHNRTGFSESDNPEMQRLMLRLRFHQRVAEN